MVQPEVFAGLLLGAMIPYIFSSFTIKSVGKAALGMVEEVRRQIRQEPGILAGTVEPDYKACIAISTRASLIEMIIPGLLVIYISNVGYSRSSPHRIHLWPRYAGWILAWSYREWCANGHLSCQHWRCLGQR